MRPLTEPEMEKVFAKLHTFVGASVKQLVDRPDELYCFRLHQQRVYYASEAIGA